MRPSLSTLALEEETLAEREWQSKVAAAAAKTDRAVDAETIGLYRKYGLPLPPRLKKVAIRQEGVTSVDNAYAGPVPPKAPVIRRGRYNRLLASDPRRGRGGRRTQSHMAKKLGGAARGI